MPWPDSSIDPYYNPGPVTWSTGTNFTFDWTNPGPYIEQPLEEREIMGTLVTSVEQLTVAPSGTTVAVTQADGSIKHWHADGKGSLSKDGVPLTAATFRTAIDNANVYIIAPVKVGDTFVSARRYHQILAPHGEDWVIGESGTRGGALTLKTEVGQPGADWRPHNRADLAEEVTAAFALLSKIHQAEQDQVRLKEILDHGDVPVEETYRITVQVEGTSSLLLTEEQVLSLVPVADITLTTIDAFDIVFTKEVTIRKRARWGCACEQVTQADVDRAIGDFDGDWGRWSVMGCEPTGKGRESTVHKAA